MEPFYSLPLSLWAFRGFSLKILLLSSLFCPFLYVEKHIRQCYFRDDRASDARL